MRKIKQVIPDLRGGNGTCKGRVMCLRSIASSWEAGIPSPCYALGGGLGGKELLGGGGGRVNKPLLKSPQYFKKVLCRRERSWESEELNVRN